MRHRSMTRSLFGSTLAVVLLAAAAGCSLGQLISAPWIRNADNNDVVFLGDSIFALSGGIQANLHAYNGGTFRNYTTSGAELEGGLIQPSIVQQFAMAEADNPNSTIVVMDGAGNDILIPVVALDPYNCLTQWYQFGWLSRSCKNFIDDLYVDGVNFLNDVDSQGVDDVIFMGYYYTKNGLLGGLDDLKEAIDYGDNRLKQACTNSVANCAFVDPRSTIRDSDIVIDGVHPNSSGSQKLANLIWPVLAPKL